MSLELPAPCRVKIGKTVYNATPKVWDAPKAPGPYFWELVAVRGDKSVKSLFPDFAGHYPPGTLTLWSSRKGARGCGLPKLVNVLFLTGPQNN